MRVDGDEGDPKTEKLKEKGEMFLVKVSLSGGKQLRNSVILSPGSTCWWILQLLTTFIMPTQYEAFSFRLFVFFLCEMLLSAVDRLIGCLQWTSQVTEGFALWSVPLISVSAWVWKISDINPCTAVAFTSWWIGTAFIKSQQWVHAALSYRRKKPHIMGWSSFFYLFIFFFSVYLQERFAWGSRAAAEEWLMRRR